MVNVGWTFSDLMPLLQKTKEILLGQIVIVSKLFKWHEKRWIGMDFIFLLDPCQKPGSQKQEEKEGLFIIV